MSTGTLTSVAQDYIKVVWGLQEWSDAPVTTKDLAERLGVGPSTVSETVRRLVSQGLLDHERYGAIHLTEQGRRHALDMVRRHRLIETFLVQHLGYTWDEVHDEAEVLEHAVSDLMVHRIDEALGHPTRDPHGDPIPSANLALTQPAALTLTVLPEGATGTVARISDDDPDVLRYFADLGFGLDAHVRVHARRDAIGVIDVLWAPTNNPNHLTELTLGLRAADAVWIETE
ncbi:metal-dependent transcriptional regulator [Jonesia denitrificans]|uniref:Manganese transport regulator n=1 Tax=Jonesia denitrificans (strain ATCC 14870 / DSM 20603 / BCRC 15368 / CIP 55.134 / JCM 11481 / NBRC 15587 / NCTC 10816 / Prevot 55134) TaxID=471856 RepID=C7R5E5_JONDD|nr:metal-dependent transcriptional regulator [Jonesia denitrificans]ACV09218.1 iron (metal) dependent repressor, DtxR family [Jonesia denitrificans DSM 20603]ASE09510.1 metal-dependent transcriptional regulator [Jonesia denitrificans]QXB44055.1 metal-dependent transcriptional regulator [Jonesia denitrificans]SQH21452.1 Iron-dependent repressor IdeR [Jonesia denitrificans]